MQAHGKPIRAIRAMLGVIGIPRSLEISTIHTGDGAVKRRHSVSRAIRL